MAALFVKTGSEPTSTSTRTQSTNPPRPTTTAAPTGVALGTGGVTPFSTNSFWNTPLAADAAVAPNSQQLVSSFDQQWRDNYGTVGINTDDFSIPIYRVPADQATVAVSIAQGCNASAGLLAADRRGPHPGERAAGERHRSLPRDLAAVHRHRVGALDGAAGRRRIVVGVLGRSDREHEPSAGSVPVPVRGGRVRSVVPGRSDQGLRAARREDRPRVGGQCGPRDRGHPGCAGQPHGRRLHRSGCDPRGHAVPARPVDRRHQRWACPPAVSRSPARCRSTGCM